ncbi:hypothetical protein ACE6H2_027032 [Prunus campanulata]
METDANRADEESATVDEVILIFMDSSFLNMRKFLAFLALLQYVPRVLRIYLLCTKLNKTPARETEVFGAFWYFLAIQREMACWQNICRNNTFLGDLCPINPHNTNATTPFDFGMFGEAVQSGVLESTNLPKKLFHCFWWALRNLSSLGQNLETSNYTWENIFAIFISLSGLLLVQLYLTANLKNITQEEKYTAAEKETSRGILLTYTTNNGAGTRSGGSSTTKCLAKGDFYGEELLTWASTFSPLPDLPISTRFVKSLTKVEAFALTANDLKIIASRFWRHFSTDARMPVHLSANLIQTNWRHRDTRRAMNRTLSSPTRRATQTLSSPVDD